jgi:hypothetical protein
MPRTDPPGTLYRVTVFDRPRGPWRDSHDVALQDAIDMGLAAYDPSQREHYCAVPTDIEVKFLQHRR